MKKINSAERLLNLTIILSSGQKLFKKYIVIACFAENESELNAKALKSL